MTVPSKRKQSYDALYSNACNNSDGSNLELFLKPIRSFLPAVYFWPTIWVDVLSNVPFLCLWYHYMLDYDCIYKERTWMNLTLPWPQKINYMQQVEGSLFEKALFVVWTLQVMATLAMVHFHLTKPHHPKFYVGTANRVAIVCHIIGGSLANFGSWIGFVLGRTSIIKVASLAGIFLHAPAAFWQSRNLHGRREIMQPLYYFMDFFLLLKYIEPWFDNASFASVVALGYAVNLFALVRVYFRLILWIGMDYDTSYDVAMTTAIVSSLPVVLGPFGCIQMVASIFLWNVMLNALLPGYRKLIQVNRTVGNVFPDVFGGKPVDFKAELTKYRKIYEDDREVVARAAYAVIAGDDDWIDVIELVELFEGWGMVDAKEVAYQVFVDVDENSDGLVSYEEFKKNLWFIWERIYCIGEAQKDEDGLTRGTSSIQEHKEHKED